MSLPPAQAREPRRHPFRWLVTLFLAVVILATLLTIAGQILLMTDVPRRMVIAELERSTGLNVEARGLTTAWRGHTVLRDVTFRLPLDQALFASAPTVEADHSALIFLLLGGFQFHGVRIDGATIDAYEDDRGRWSLPRAIEAVQRATPQQATDGNAENLPKITLAQTTVRITRLGAPAVSLPLEFDGFPDTSLTWKFEGSLGSGTKVSGRLTPGGWAHEVDATLDGLEPILAIWMPRPPQPARMTAHWSGEVTGGRVTGELRIADLSIQDFSAQGDAAIRFEGGALTVHPREIRVASPRIPSGPLVLSRGTVKADRLKVETDHLRAELTGLASEIAGTWDIDADTVKATAAWSGAIAGQAVKHYGSADIAAKIPVVGRRAIDVKLDTHVETGAQQWQARLAATASGISWNAMDAEISAPSLMLFNLGEPIDLSGFTVTLTERWPVITLLELAVPGANVSRSMGAIDLTTQKWDVGIDADGWTIRQLGHQPVAFSLAASGDFAHVDFSRLRLAAPQAELIASGSFVPGREPPFQAHAEMNATMAAPPPKETEAAFRNQARKEAGEPEEAESAGTVNAAMEVAGHLVPTQLSARGHVHAEHIRAGKGVLMPIDVEARATADPDGARLETGPFPILNGQVTLAAWYRTKTKDAEAHLHAANVSLETLAKLAEPRLLVAGNIGADVDFRMPELDVRQIQMDGAWDVARLRTGAATFKQGRGRISYRQGRVELSDINIAEGEAALTGKIGFQGNDPRHLAVDMISRRWPVELEETGLSALVDSHAKLEVDAVELGAEGTLSINADATLENRPLGSITAQTAIHGQTIDVQDLTAAILGGRIKGNGVVPLANWITSTGDLSIDGVNFENLGDLAKAMGDLRGVVSGTVAVRPSTDPRALEPLRFEAALKIKDGRQRGMQFGDMNLVGFAGPGRIMLDRSTWQVANGTVSFWSRLTWHGDEPFVHVSLDSDSLDLDQLIRAVDPTISDTPGVVTGRAAFGGYLYQPHRSYGIAEFTLRNSDLGRVPVVSQLYGLLNLDFRRRVPEGRGIARFRLEGDALQLERLHYYNQGADVVASATLDNIWRGQDSPIRGVAAAALRPLKQANVPFGADLDRLLRAVFVGAASVRIDGTLANRRLEVVPFSEVSTTVNRLLGRQTEQ